MMIAIMSIIRRQWVDYDRLTFRSYTLLDMTEGRDGLSSTNVFEESVDVAGLLFPLSFLDERTEPLFPICATHSIAQQFTPV